MCFLRKYAVGNERQEIFTDYVVIVSNYLDITGDYLLLTLLGCWAHIVKNDATLSKAMTEKEMLTGPYMRTRSHDVQPSPPDPHSEHRFPVPSSKGRM